LRRKLIGKNIVYRIEHQAESGRCYGEVWLDQEDVRLAIVSNGWATFATRERKDQTGKPFPPKKEDLALLNGQEEASKKKNWNLFR